MTKASTSFQQRSLWEQREGQIFPSDPHPSPKFLIPGIGLLTISLPLHGQGPHIQQVGLAEPVETLFWKKKNKKQQHLIWLLVGGTGKRWSPRQYTPPTPRVSQGLGLSLRRGFLCPQLGGQERPQSSFTWGGHQMIQTPASHLGSQSSSQPPSWRSWCG